MENIFLLVMKFAAGGIRVTLTLRGIAPIPSNCQNAVAERNKPQPVLSKS